MNNSLYLSRHGEAESNVQKILAHTIKTWLLFALTDKWKQDIRYEAKQRTDFSVDLIITSPILRTEETAKIYQEYFWGDIITDMRLIERNDGIFDNCHLDEYLNRYNQEERNLLVDAPIWGENHMDVKNRLELFLQEIDEKYDNKKVLLVSHGSPSAIISAIKNNQPIPESNVWISFPKNKIIKL